MMAQPPDRRSLSPRPPKRFLRHPPTSDFLTSFPSSRHSPSASFFRLFIPPRPSPPRPLRHGDPVSVVAISSPLHSWSLSLRKHSRSLTRNQPTSPPPSANRNSIFFVSSPIFLHHPSYGPPVLCSLFSFQSGGRTPDLHTQQSMSTLTPLTLPSLAFTVQANPKLLVPTFGTHLVTSTPVP